MSDAELNAKLDAVKDRNTFFEFVGALIADRVRFLQHREPRRRVPRALLHINRWLPPAPPTPRARIETRASPVGQPSSNALPHVLPRFAPQFAGEDAPRASLELARPRGFDRCLIHVGRFVQARQELGRHVRAVALGKRERFAEEFFRAIGHPSIVIPAARLSQPEKV